MPELWTFDNLIIMSSDLPESDWRRFKEIHTRVLERYCVQVLRDVAGVSQGSEGSAHDRYLKIYKLVEDADEQIEKVFSDYRRSTADLQLGLMRRMKLLTDAELALFSEQTRTRIEGIASL